MRHELNADRCGACQKKYDRLNTMDMVEEKRESDKIKRAHVLAIMKRERDQVMRDLGMTKVRGNLGGVYWE